MNTKYNNNISYLDHSCTSACSTPSSSAKQDCLSSITQHKIQVISVDLSKPEVVEVVALEPTTNFT